MTIVPFCELTEGQEADFFAVFVKKESKLTSQGKPYYSITIRDANRTVTFPVWNNSEFYPLVESLNDNSFIRVAGVYKINAYGPQIDLIQMRLVDDSDRQDGFDEKMFVAKSQFDPEEMFKNILFVLKKYITEDDPLYTLCETILTKNKTELLSLSAASHNHHAFVGGWLEHTRNVLCHAVTLAHYYTKVYPELTPPLDMGLVAAGAALHDIGKLEEIAFAGVGFEYTVEGNLIGHMLQGRDIVRDACKKLGFSGQRFTLLEHVIIAHQRLPEWGAPKPPMIPEALLVHYADDVDAKFAIMYNLEKEIAPGKFSPSKNTMGYKVYRPEEEEMGNRE